MKRNARSSTGDADVALCQGAALESGAPEWIQLMPFGRSETVNGLGPFVLNAADAADVIAASARATPDGQLVVDLNHATDLAARNGGPSPAQGWISEMQARADGLYGRVAWTEAGKAALSDRAYRFVSPVVTYARSTGKVLSILRAALTNNPNIHRLPPVLNTATEVETDMDFLKALNAALGLAALATEQDALAAVKTLKETTALNSANLAKIAKAAKVAETADAETVLNAVASLADPAKTVPAATFEEVKTALNAATTRITELENGAKREKAEAFVDGAIKAGRAGVKPSRDHFVALHMANPAEAEKVINGLPVLTGRADLPKEPPGTGTALNQAETDVAKLLGLKPEDYAKTRNSLEEAR